MKIRIPDFDVKRRKFDEEFKSVEIKGIFTGAFVIHPITQIKMPIFISESILPEVKVIIA